MKEADEKDGRAGSSTDATDKKVMVSKIASEGEDDTLKKSKLEVDEYTRQTGFRYDAKKKGRPSVSKES